MGLLNKFSKKKGNSPQVVTPDDVKKPTKTPAKSGGRVENSSAKQMGSAFRILVKPLLSEKVAMLESKGSYVFAVNPQATKTEIKRAVFEVYGEMPIRVRTARIEGKNVRFGSSLGRRSDWKKAIVTLKKGASIQIHEGV